MRDAAAATTDVVLLIASITGEKNGGCRELPVLTKQVNYVTGKQGQLLNRAASVLVS